MTHEKLFAILDLVVQKTRAGKAEWEVGPDGISFLLPLPSATIVVDSLDDDGARPYRLAVLDPGDHPTVLVSLEQDYSPDVGEWSHPELELLYQSARDRALAIEPLLDEVIRDLRRDVSHQDSASA